MKVTNLLIVLLIVGFFAACSSSQEVEKLAKQFKASQSDKDFDGVTDMHDKGDSTLPGVKVYGDGTPVDTDQDGIPDFKDSEIFSPQGAKVDSIGRAVDSDKDGVPDALDREPNTPAGSLVNFQGIAIGKSPVAPAQIEGLTTNTSNTTVKVASVSNSAFPIVTFKYSFELEDYNLPSIILVYNYLNTNPGSKIQIIGHTDNIGNPEANFQLGKHRAEVVANVLTTLGISKDRIVIDSKGENQPLIDPTDFSLRRLNRRVEFQLVK